jgi:D-amino peptidase
MTLEVNERSHSDLTPTKPSQYNANTDESKLFGPHKSAKGYNMKVCISADIEGITGTTHWDEASKSKPDYREFQEQMTAEVAAACEGALRAGATEILVKDAHDSARNIIAAKLPREARLVRGWSGHPFSMVQYLDETFCALLLVGFHSSAGADTNPLAHTISGRIARVKINDRYASEMLLHAYAAALVNVPLVYIAGDAGICEEAASLNPQITTTAVKQGVGDSTVSIHPHLAVDKIKKGAQTALEGDVSRCQLQMPERFSVEIEYRDHAQAYRASFYPGVSQTSPHAIQFESDDYFEVLRLISFVI